MNNMEDLPTEHAEVFNLFKSITKTYFLPFMMEPSSIAMEDKKAIFKEISMRLIKHLLLSYLGCRTEKQKKQIAEQAERQFMLALAVALEKQ